MLATLKAVFEDITLTFLPFGLQHNHILPGGMEAILYRGLNAGSFINQNIFDFPILVSISAIIFLVALALFFHKKYSFISFGIGWFFLTLLPSLTFLPQGTLMHERFLYLPSFAASIIVGGTFIYLKNKNFRKYYSYSIAIVILIFLFITVNRNTVWHDPITFWTRDIQIAPKQNAYAYFQLGREYIMKNDQENAIKNYLTAYRINPHFAVSVGSAALVYQSVGDFDQAIKYFNLAVLADPNFWEGHLNLAKIYLAQGNLNLANAEFIKAISINPNLLSKPH
jgi:tetratricopeptide (TPR) repeat protein